MAGDVAEIDSGTAPDAAPKGKARLLSLSDLDRRTSAYRKVCDLISSIETDLGGSDRLSAAERQIIESAAVTTAMLGDLGIRWLAGEPIDPAIYCTLSNAQRRLFETVGLRRVPREVDDDLRSYLAQRAEAQDSSGAVSAPIGERPGDQCASDHASPIAGHVA